MKLQVIKILHDTIVDGPGFRTTIYCAGCMHKCIGCQNPSTWDFTSGTSMDVSDVFNEIANQEFNDVTFSGGDPLYQIDAFIELARMIKSKTTKSIWCFTGFTYEEILEMGRGKEFLELIDVLVDGPFIKDLANSELKFKGSANQRILNLNEGRVV